MDDHLDVGIDAFDRFLRGLGLWASDIFRTVGDLALKVGKINGVEVEHADFADAGGGQVHGNWGAESAGANAQYAGGTDFLLPGQSNFRQDEVTRVAAYFVVVQFHRTWAAA
jgi:hypothetical protein